MPTKKLLGAAALMAALAGGGVAGALLGAPSISSAQEDGSTTTTVDDGSSTTDEGNTAGESGDAEELDGYCLGGPGFGRPGRIGLAAAAEALGMTRAELHEALPGSTIAEVAEAQGVELQTVVDAMVAAATERIDEALEDGRIAEDRAEELKEALPDRIAELVQREFPEEGFGRHHRGPRPLPGDEAESDADASAEDDGS